jgi:hypothetical protein
MRSPRTAALVVAGILIMMAFVDASTASANGSTQLCQVHTGLTCEGGTAVVNLANEGLVRFLNSIATVLCLNVTSTIIPLALGNPQEIHTLGLSFSNCGTSSTHSNCEITVPEMPLADLLKVGLDEGILTFLSGKIHLHCTKVTIFNVTLDCEYGIAGLEFPVGGQHLTAAETPVEEIGEKTLCPSEPTFDALLETTKAETEPSLCKVHTSICKTGDLVGSIDTTTTTAPVLLNAVANVECKSSLLAASVKDPMLPSKPIELHASSLTWAECHPQGSGNACTVTTTELPTFDLTRTALNLGQANALGMKLSVACASLSLECVFSGKPALAFEGASHTAGAGHGMFTASGATLEKLEGGANCPASVKWDALYELPEDTYLGPILKGESTYVLA